MKTPKGSSPEEIERKRQGEAIRMIASWRPVIRLENHLTVYHSADRDLFKISLDFDKEDGPPPGVLTGQQLFALVQELVQVLNNPYRTGP